MSVVLGLLALVVPAGVLVGLGVFCLIQRRVSWLYTVLGLIYLLAALAWLFYLVIGLLGAIMMAMDDHLLRFWTARSSAALSLAGLGVFLLAARKRLRLAVWLSLPTLVLGAFILWSLLPNGPV